VTWKEDHWKKLWRSKSCEKKEMERSDCKMIPLKWEEDIVYSETVSQSSSRKIKGTWISLQK
jgi:hypothetical protein